MAIIKCAHKYVDRGDPSSYDRSVGDFTTDATWRDLDLGPNGLDIVPVGAQAVDILVSIRDDAVNSFMQFRKNGNVNNYNVGAVRTQVANVSVDAEMTIPCDINGVIEYNGSNVVFTIINLAVKGWWI